MSEDYLRVQYKCEVEVSRMPDVLSLAGGTPGKDTMANVKDVLLKATTHLLDQEVPDLAKTLGYGDEKGDPQFCEELARFLTKEYGDSVDSSNLMVTAGATQGLHMIVTLLFDTDTVIFTEDPTYFAAWKMLRQDLRMQLVPVPCDADGVDTDAFDELLSKHRPKDVQLTPKKPYWTMLYTIPVFNNPTTRCHSAERCRKLVEVARKHDVLLVAEDIYNLVHFGDPVAPPRLLTYDRPGDGQGWGHTLSVGTFSKILAPGLRLGWVEGPAPVLRLLYDSYMSWGGGSLNHYGSKLAAVSLQMGLQTNHLAYVRGIYKAKRDAVCKVLKENLPEGSSFLTPQGGFFVWIEFPKGTDAFEMMKWLIPNYKVFVMPGVCASMTGQYRNCVRICTSYLDKEDEVEATKRLCKGATEFIRLHKASA